MIFNEVTLDNGLEVTADIEGLTVNAGPAVEGGPDMVVFIDPESLAELNALAATLDWPNFHWER